MVDWMEYLGFRVFRLFRRLHLNRMIRMGSSSCIFVDCFKNFEKLEAVKGIFGEKTQEVLQNLKVEFTWFGGYMFIDSSDACPWRPCRLKRRMAFFII